MLGWLYGREKCSRSDDAISDRGIRGFQWWVGFMVVESICCFSASSLERRPNVKGIAT